ncbi:hypothetical protein E0H73_05075 [Kribbella pittospori]|uniref:Uncharacterized protein n=1 Tax=Kribbella pittospori TaxID=722689 RepID=A0A4R0L111_9ACTN|nr:hypothetical protein E0H73_05075 [Kribbella pittospori]
MRSTPGQTCSPDSGQPSTAAKPAPANRPPGAPHTPPPRPPPTPRNPPTLGTVRPRTPRNRGWCVLKVAVGGLARGLWAPLDHVRRGIVAGGCSRSRLVDRRADFGHRSTTYAAESWLVGAQGRGWWVGAGL